MTLRDSVVFLEAKIAYIALMPLSREGRSVAATLLKWWDRNRRDLPWRAGAEEKPDPYAVWLSEVMLQQTSTSAIKSYYAAFLMRWPNVCDLAQAPLEDVMKAWAGLGYYSRARNLHACARIVARREGARFPDTEDELRSLPGVGAYTAAAIAAIAFDRRAIVVDGNVERVASRLFAIEARPPALKRLVREAVDELTPKRRSGDFAQAMMDIGATICTPRNPACASCPISAMCRARAQGLPESFPLKAHRRGKPLRHGAVFYLRRDDGRVLVRTRPPTGLLGAMTEFPGSEWTEAAPKSLAAAPMEADWRLLRGRVRHVFTHFALDLSIYRARAAIGVSAPPGCRWTPEETLAHEALPTLMRKVAEQAQNGLLQSSSEDSATAPRPS